MKFVTPSLVVQDSDGFRNDALQRQSFGEALSNIVIRSTDELVISLDGKWGEGKTTFVKMWQGLLQEKGIPSIYIDAFQNDYTEDAFISIAGAITSYVDQHAAEKEKSCDFKVKAKKVGVRFLAWSAKVGVKAATLGAIEDADIEALSGIGDDLAADASEAIGELVKARLSAHSKEVELIQSFRDTLSAIPAALKENSSGRLVVIIDELDRCKPTFAVEVLEKIKHLFSVKNVVFFLVMHKAQLEEAIRCVYGSKIDAHTYLQKFINIEATLPKRVGDRYRDNNDFQTYSKRLLKQHELETWGDDENIISCIAVLAKHFDLSLRQLEKAFTNLAVIYSTSGKDHLRLVPIIAFICVVKVIRPSLFNQLLLGQLPYSLLQEQLGLSALDVDQENQHYLIRIMDWVRYSMLTDSEFNTLDTNDPLRKFGSSLWGYSIDRKKLIPIFCQKLSLFVVN